MNDLTLQIIRLIVTIVASFLLALFFTPFLSSLLRRYKLVKKVTRANVPVFSRLHKKKEGTPTMGGILVWGTVIIIMVIFGLVSKFGKGTYLETLISFLELKLFCLLVQCWFVRALV